MSKDEKTIKRLQKRIMKLFLRTQVLKSIAEDAIRETETIKDENKRQAKSEESIETGSRW